MTVNVFDKAVSVILPASLLTKLFSIYIIIRRLYWVVCLKYDQTCIINFGEKAKDSNGTIIVNIQFALLFIKVT